ncbi:hypothetical protein NDU88_002843 [Pleurodeles waltl]|uniref:Uncharacterized protein n=1 Tax=Pleurodeles waltl TaxID=8319 RepID=A0AAV7MSU6_PLEWA|nr:hypothetical protein NDU88_002843 [Pleurodeles waltl]
MRRIRSPEFRQPGGEDRGRLPSSHLDRIEGSSRTRGAPATHQQGGLLWDDQNKLNDRVKATEEMMNEMTLQVKTLMQKIARMDTDLKTLAIKVDNAKSRSRQHNIRLGQEKGYSYYSAVHNTHSRLDYFLPSADILPKITMAEYQARGISDHPPLLMLVSLGPRPPGKEWRMQTWRLQNMKVVEELEQGTQYYFTENKGSVQSLVVLSEAYKATIRGEIIAGEVGERRHREK